MTLHELCCIDGDARFRIGKSKIVWVAASFRPTHLIYISRVCKDGEKGGKPFIMGLKYKSRYADPDSIITLVDK